MGWSWLRSFGNRRDRSIAWGLRGCPASGLTLQEGVEKAIKEYRPETQTIEKAKGLANLKNSDAVPLNFVSPFANGRFRLGKCS